jgi:hypothetical protein
MSTEFRPSDLVPAGFIAELITHIDDETCILLSRAGRYRVMSGMRKNVANGSKPLLPPGRGPPL